MNIKNVKYKISIEINNNQARLKSISDYKLLETIIKIWERENRDLINNRFTDAYQEKYDDIDSNDGSRVLNDNLDEVDKKNDSSDNKHRMDDILVDLDREDNYIQHLVRNDDTSFDNSSRNIQISIPIDYQSPEVAQHKFTPNTSERNRGAFKNTKERLASIHSKESNVIVFNKDNIEEFQNYVDELIYQNKSLSKSVIPQTDSPTQQNTSKKRIPEDISEKQIPPVKPPKLEKSNISLCSEKVLGMCMETNRSKPNKTEQNKEEEKKIEENTEPTNFLTKMKRFILCNW